MKYGLRVTLALAFVALVAMSAVAFGQQGSPSPSPDGDLPAVEKLERRGMKHRMRHGMKGKFGRRMVTGEFKIQTDDGFATVRVDRGTVKSVSGNTLTLERADGETVTVTANDDTKIVKDREAAELSDIDAGDLVHVMQRNDGDGFVLKAIRAHKPESETSTTGARQTLDAA